MTKLSLFIPSLLLLLGCLPSPPQNPFEDPSYDFSHGTPFSAPADLLRIYVFDVGQGNSALVIGPTGQTLLIDAGPPLSGEMILSHLALLEVTELDWVLLTHYDADHIGGLSEVLVGLEGISENILDRGDETSKVTEAYLHYKVLSNSSRKTMEPGMVLDLGGGATAQILVVNGNYADGTSIESDPEDENSFSAALLIQYGNFRYYTDGDLTGGGSSGERNTLDLETPAGFLAGDVDVLHVSHHGSGTGTPESFLEAILPEAAIISVGKSNDYGHPHPSILYRLREAGVEVFRTDQMGTLEIQTDGYHYKIMEFYQ